MKYAALILFTAGAALPCSADIYKCVSAQGAVDYRDSPCEPEAKAEKFVLQDDGPASAEAAEHANRETMAHIKGALDIYQQTREQTRADVEADRAAHPEAASKPVIVEPPLEYVYPVTGYYGGLPDHYHGAPGHHHHDHGSGYGTLGNPDLVNKGDPNWVLQTPDTSYQARQRAKAQADRLSHRIRSSSNSDEQSGETSP